MIPPRDIQNDDYEWLRQADHTASRDFDRALMTLAAGALAVSIAFIHDVAPKPVHVAWLGMAWGLFALSLVAILVGFLTSQLSLQREMRLVLGTEDEEKGGKWYGTFTVACNGASAAAFVLGVGALVVFALYNLGGR